MLRFCYTKAIYISMIMSEQLNEYETRLQRLQQLKDAGVIPYANRYDKKQNLSTLAELGNK